MHINDGLQAPATVEEASSRPVERNLRHRSGSLSPASEFGDGFMLTFDRKDIDWAGQGLTTATFSVADELDLLVVGPHSIFASDYAIDWDTKKYTYDPDASRSRVTLAESLG